MKAPAFKKIVIVGLGLMGGSLAAAIRKNSPKTKVIGVARRRKTLDLALRNKWIHQGFLSVSEALEQADLVVICTPVDLTKRILKEVDRFSKRSVLVTDIGSVKSPICRFAKSKKWKSVRFVGAHPMVGSHEKGIEAARANLYGAGLTILTGTKNQPGFQKISTFWKAFSGKVIVMSPEQHDEKIAEISHLPHLISVCLAQTPSNSAYAVAGTGFRDTSRLAQGDASVSAPIFLENKMAVLKAVRSFYSNLNHFESALKSKDSKKLTKILKQVAVRRRALSPLK